VIRREHGKNRGTITVLRGGRRRSLNHNNMRGRNDVYLPPRLPVREASENVPRIAKRLLASLERSQTEGRKKIPRIRHGKGHGLL